MKAKNYLIQPLRVEDLPAVLDIERQCYPHPWSEEQFRQELNNPVARIDLLWLDGHLAGYTCSWLVLDELQIHNVATSPHFQRRGVAGCLLSDLFERCRALGMTRAWLEVRVGNAAAISLYRQQGFVADGVRPRYYRDGEDALLMYREFLS